MSEVITQEKLMSLFEYNDGFLFWNKARRGVKVGIKAGGVNPTTGYWRVAVDGKSYLLHRLIFLYHKGYLPRYIDHADGNQLNNRVENLRECTQSQNMANSIGKSRFGLPKGVSKHGSGYRVKLMVNGKQHNLGTYATIGIAKDCYDLAAELAFCDFARK